MPCIILVTFLLAMLRCPIPVWAADYDCLIEPRQLLKHAAPVTGVVATIAVDRGDVVHAGQIVAQLESEVEEASAQIATLHAANETIINANRARVEYLRRKNDRNTQLRTNNIVSFATADETMADLAVAEAQLKEAELNVGQARLEAKRAQGLLRQRTVLSPVNGVVTERALGPGEFRNDQAHILTVAELDPLSVEAFLPLGIYGTIRPGMTVEVMPQQPVGGQYKAKVIVVDRVFDAASGTIGVRFELPNPQLKIPAGVHCRVSLVSP